MKHKKLNEAFYLNAGWGKLEKVKELYAKGADINYKKSGSTPLMNAVERREVEVVEFLLDKNANVDAVDYVGRTALFYTAGRIDIAERLLEKGAKLNHKDNDGKTAFLFSAPYVWTDLQGNFLKLMQGNKNADENQAELNEAFIKAAENGNLAGCRNLLALGADINTRNKAGYSAIGVAIKFFLDREDQKELDLKLAEFLIENKADLDCQSGQPPLILAARFGNLAAVQFLLENGANPNVQNRYGTTPLMATSRRKYTSLSISGRRSYQLDKVGKKNPYDEVIKILLQYHADVNLKNTKGKTFEQINKNESDKREFFKALLARNYVEMEKLIKSGFSPNKKMKVFLEFSDAWNPSLNYYPIKKARLLNYAIGAGDVELVHFLLRMGADPNRKSHIVPLEQARKSNRNEIVTLLLKVNAKEKTVKDKQKFDEKRNINKANNHLNIQVLRSFMEALKTRNYPKLGKLIQDGFPINARLKKLPSSWSAWGAPYFWDNAISKVFFIDKNDTALSYAVNENDDILVEFLLKMGANPNMRTSASNLNQAIKNFNPVIVELLLKAHARYFEKGRYHHAVGVYDNEKQLNAWKKNKQYLFYMTKEESLLKKKKIDELLRVHQVKLTKHSLLPALPTAAVTDITKITQALQRHRGISERSSSFMSGLSFWGSQEQKGNTERKEVELFRKRYGHS